MEHCKMVLKLPNGCSTCFRSMVLLVKYLRSCIMICFLFGTNTAILLSLEYCSRLLSACWILTLIYWKLLKSILWRILSWIFSKYSFLNLIWSEMDWTSLSKFSIFSLSMGICWTWCLDKPELLLIEASCYFVIAFSILDYWAYLPFSTVYWTLC